ncbi:CP2K6 protein, partial [Psilopogon haemacephalus]|nr:CP2K6 protein [Psilopogon haemacephalus]
WSSSTSIGLVFILIFLSVLKLGGFCHQRKKLPPGPKALPIIGNLHLFDLKRPYRTYIQLAEVYGPVFSIQMGQRTVVVISGYETVKEALVNQADAFAERPKIPIFEDLTRGNGIVFAHGENWKVMRRFTLMTLRDFGMGKKAIEERIVEEYGYLADTIGSQEGKPFDASKMLNAAVANIIVSILLGKRFDYKDSRFLRLQELTNESMRLAGKPLVTLYNIFPQVGFLLRANKTLLQNRNEFHAFVETTFLEYLKTLDKNDQRSFIDAFLVKQQEEKSSANGHFHNGNLLSLVSNLFTAGVETITTTLNWGFLLMLKYPEIQRKVQEEIEEVLGSNPPRIEHRTQMPYTDAVIHEIQRFANILPLDLPHETAADVTLKGYFIPKGTYIVPLLASVLQDKSQWEKPDTFYPEHFLDASGKFVKKEAFMPFSAGRRICAGETLAKMELFLFFTSLLQKFTFQPPPGVAISDLDLSPAISFNVIPKPYQMCAVKRF